MERKCAFFMHWTGAHGRETGKCENMKWFWAILALGICAGGIMYIMDRNAKELRKEAALREEKRQAEEERRLEQERIEAEKLRAERAEALAKEDAVRLLQKYITFEEERLKEEAEELKLRLQSVGIDKKRLSDEMALLEKEAQNREENARRRNAKRRDYNERVEAMLKSEVLNSLAATYLGEDFSSALHKFRSDIGNIVKRHERAKAQLDANRRKMQLSMKEADEELERLERRATEELKAARGKLAGSSKVARERVAKLRKSRDRLQHKVDKGLATPKERRDLELITAQLEGAEAQLNSNEATEGLGGANATHLQLTREETRARKRSDTALAIRQDDDSAVHRELNFESSLFAEVALYEKTTIDRLRDTMRTTEIAYAKDLAQVEKKLKRLSNSTAKIDMLDAEGIKTLQKQIAEELMDGLEDRQ